MQEVASATGGNKDLTGPQVAGMLVGMILTMFLMMFGAQVYSKVRKEKSQQNNGGARHMRNR